MRIEGSYRPTGSGRSTAAGRGSTGEVFRLDGGAAARETSAAAATTASPTIDSLLALQAVADPLLGRRKAVRRGTQLLDALDSLKADLLAGRIGEGRLNLLMALLGQARGASEPDLESLLDDIELRARVELAKLGRFPQS